jgi:hypothetical protein
MTHTQYIGCGLTLLLMSGTLSIAQESDPHTARAHSRLIISFTSPGDGIDYRAKKQIDESISSYEKERGVRLAKEEIHWGREGELDYCFKLSELSKEDQENFVSRIKSLVKKSKRTGIVENSPCRKRRPA